MGMGWTKRRGPLVCAVAAASLAVAVYARADYSVPAGPFARTAPCSDVVARLPETLMGRGRDDVDGAGAAGWGDRAVVLRCGVEPLAPTIDTCVNVNGFDWVLDDAGVERDGAWVFTTYGREPAVEVAFAGGSRPAGDALVALNDALGGLARKTRCLSTSDT
ncbi:DUF3515 domain-containing protein (plasmid) [Streptomyces sp. NBC_01426]|uniref:DUF3515 family protein n=1 Tax=Streptomyces sp. NBC_01426 TaxID=2975866 RepID=UPI002E35D32C|nr:DUF3515 family protein [Streptomyces sp. NBC_01426]